MKRKALKRTNKSKLFSECTIVSLNMNKQFQFYGYEQKLEHSIAKSSERK